MIVYNTFKKKWIHLNFRTASMFGFLVIIVTILFYFNLQLILEIYWKSQQRVLPIKEIDDNFDLFVEADDLIKKINDATTPTLIVKNDINNGLNSPWTHFKDSFMDLMQFLREARNESFPKAKAFEYVIVQLDIDTHNPTIGETLNETLPENATVFEKFQMAIYEQELYKEGDPMIPELLHALATDPFDEISDLHEGTQLKFIMYFEDGGKAMVKPRRYPRTQDTLPNHPYFSDYERHTSEIASFHLDRILGFRRAAPVVGRRINVTELEELASDEFRETFFISPANNSCFYGNCTYYCDVAHAFCGDGDMIEASVVAFLPLFDEGLEKHWRSPWRRSYAKRLRVNWEKNNSYCETVKENPLYSSGRRLLDVMDMVVLDFLTGNQDRHHYETFSIFGNDSSILHIDHGRAFGRPYFDDPSILTPILQCCLIRDTTLQTLLNFHNGPKRLSQLMRESLDKDPIAPILLEPHLLALDRRVKILLYAVRQCIQKTENTIRFHDIRDDLKNRNLDIDWNSWKNDKIGNGWFVTQEVT